MITFDSKSPKNMSKEETVSQLKLIKQAVSKLAINYASEEFPTPIPEFQAKLEPFIEIEKAIYQAINRLEK
jgi:hypothetical protein